MEKALEILKEIDEVVINKYHKNKDITFYENDILFIKEAISELEEAMKTKTCDRCAYCEPFNSVCFNDKSPLCADSVNSEYGCIYWERKDNA